MDQSNCELNCIAAVVRKGFRRSACTARATRHVRRMMSIEELIQGLPRSKVKAIMDRDVDESTKRKWLLEARRGEGLSWGDVPPGSQAKGRSMRKRAPPPADDSKATKRPRVKSKKGAGQGSKPAGRGLKPAARAVGRSVTGTKRPAPTPPCRAPATAAVAPPVAPPAARRRKDDDVDRTVALARAQEKLQKDAEEARLRCEADAAAAAAAEELKRRQADAVEAEARSRDEALARTARDRRAAAAAAAVLETPDASSATRAGLPSGNHGGINRSGLDHVARRTFAAPVVSPRLRAIGPVALPTTWLVGASSGRLDARGKLGYYRS